MVEISQASLGAKPVYSVQRWSSVIPMYIVCVLALQHSAGTCRNGITAKSLRNSHIRECRISSKTAARVTTTAISGQAAAEISVTTRATESAATDFAKQAAVDSEAAADSEAEAAATSAAEEAAAAAAAAAAAEFQI